MKRYFLFAISFLAVIVVAGAALALPPVQLKVPDVTIVSVAPCTPQVVLSGSTDHFAGLKTGDVASSYLVKVVGKMADGVNFWDHYKKSGDFEGVLYSGDGTASNDAVSLHCNPGDAADGQYFLCVGSVPGADMPGGARLMIKVTSGECGWSTRMELKDDANANNVADSEEGNESAPVGGAVVSLADSDGDGVADVYDDCKEEEGRVEDFGCPPTIEEDASANLPSDMPSPPPAGASFSEGSCGMIPAGAASPMGLIMIVATLAAIGVGRRRK